MAFENGKPRAEGAGRKQGTPNKRTQLLADLAEEYGANPALFLIHIMMGNSEKLALNNEEPKISFEDRKDAARELMPYLYGKRKPIDSDGNDNDPVAAFIEAISGSK